MADQAPQQAQESPESLAGIAAALAVGAGVSEAPGAASVASNAVRDAGVAALIVGMLPAAIVSRYPDAVASAIRDALALAGSSAGLPVARLYSDGPLGVRMHHSEMLMRARYIWAATKRLIAARREGDLGAGLNREASYLASHRRMVAHRVGASRTLDEAVKRWGLVLSWNAMLDGSTTPECRDASGKNFDVRKPPRIGVPGIGPHGGCRCWPGPPRPDAPMI